MTGFRGSPTETGQVTGAGAAPRGWAHSGSHGDLPGCRTLVLCLKYLRQCGLRRYGGRECARRNPAMRVIDYSEPAGAGTHPAVSGRTDFLPAANPANGKALRKDPL